MGEFLGIGGLLGAAAFIVLLIVAIFRKSPKQKWVTGILASVLCMSFGIMISLNDSINVIEKELKEVTEAKEGLETEMVARKAKENLGETSLDAIRGQISELLGSDIVLLDDAIVFIIPVDGTTFDDILNNSLSKMGRINDYLETLVYTHSLTQKEHFYFRTVDKNGNAVMERYINPNGENSHITMEVEYINKMY